MLQITTNNHGQTATIPVDGGWLQETAVDPSDARMLSFDQISPLYANATTKSEEFVAGSKVCELCGHEKASQHLCQSCVEMIARLKWCVERTPELQWAIAEYNYARLQKAAAAAGK